MPYCPECGESVDDGYMFCPECGRDLDGAAGASDATAASAKAAGGADRAAGADTDAWGATNAGVGDSGTVGERGPAAGETGGTDRGVTREEPVPTADAGDEADPADAEPTTDVEGPSPHEAGPFAFAAKYATRDGWDPIVIGAVIEFAGIIVPFVNLMVRGFGFRVSKAAARGQTDPPEFDEYGEMFVDGFRIAAIVLLYVAVFGIAGLVLGALGTVVHEVAGVLAALGVFLVAAYLLPASLTTYAAFGEIGYAVSPSHAGEFATTGTYLKGYLFYLVLSAGVSVVALVSLVTIVGIFAVVAWSTYAYGALWGYVYREAVEKEEVPPAPAEPV